MFSPAKSLSITSMRLKTAALFLSAILLATLAGLYISFEKTNDLLNYESQELFNSGESIRVAQSIRTNLLERNRDAFLKQLKGEPYPKGPVDKFRIEIENFLTQAEKFVNDEEEQEILNTVRSDVSTYFAKRESLKSSAASSVKDYTLLSQYVDRAMASIEKLVDINQVQMNELTQEISKQNAEAKKLASLFLGLGAFLILAVIISIFRFVTRPLSDIAEVITRYSCGEAAARTHAQGLDEIQKVGQNFNTMAEALETRRQDQLRFIASIAHDLRNPLNSMSMASEIITQTVQGKSTDFAQIIFRQVKNLDRLVGDLLDTTRIESGQLSLKPIAHDLRKIIQEAIELHQTGLEIHTLRFECPESPNFYICDGARVAQVMNNLLSNAIKYSPSGGDIKIQLSETADGIAISVHDQGMGIEPSDLESIFKPFHRSKATKTTIPGIGLGLSASRKIIQAHGGQLSVESRPGQGSTFTIHLPKAQAAQKRAIGLPKSFLL